MSLDVYLMGSKKLKLSEKGSHIFIRENGKTIEISREEWDKRYPNREPVTFNYEDDGHEIFSNNITHNLGQMADKVGIYIYLWRPEEIGITKAKQLIKPLESGLKKLKGNPEEYKKYNPKNNWGDYEGLVEFVEKYIDACKENPDADIYVSR